jgi:hypothetical protein
MGNSIKINSLQMGSFYDYELGYRLYLDMGDAVLDYSLFSEFMMENKLSVNKRGKSFDFIMCKFDYGTNDLTGSKIRNKYYTTGFTIDWTQYNYNINIERINNIVVQEEKSKELNKLESKMNANKKHEIITYKMLMRSMGKSKEGDCLFVNSSLYDIAHDYINMDIKLPKDNSRIVEMSAYNTLTCANMINSIRIELKNILILEDQEVETLVKAVQVNTETVQKPIEVVDYQAMEKQANELGFTFYKKNELREDGYEYIEDQSKDNIETNLKIEIVYKDTGKKSSIPDYKTMETQANSMGYTFYKKNELYQYIKNYKKKDIIDLGIEFVEKESKNNLQVFDFKAMEVEANKIGHTFFKKEANKDGYELIDRDILIAEDKGITIITKISKINDVEECYVERSDEPVSVKNVMWDGMGVIDSILIPEGCSGYVYLRNHMTKVCCFEGEVIQLLKERYGDKYETATREDMFKNQINVRDIRMIITNKALKWLKFTDLMGENPYEYFDNILKKYGYKFAVVKTAHPSKYGKLQRMSYQGSNSLPCLNENDLRRIAKTSINYGNDLKTKDNSFINHLKITASNYNINNVLIELSKHNSKFLKTLYASSERASIISKFKKERLELGKLLQVGDNLTICGNPYALLMYAVGEDWKQDPTLNKIDGAIQCYTTRFNDGEHLAGYRSPQNAPNNTINCG